MIRHICMFKLKEENKEINIKAFFERVQSLKEIEQIRNFEVVKNAATAPDQNYDVSLLFDFDTIEDLNSYQADPRHKAFGGFVREIREERACIDYEY